MTSFNLQEQYRNYQDNQPTLLPDGEYTLQVTGVNTNQDGDKLFPQYKVVGGPYAGKAAFCGSLTLSEKAARIFFRQLRGFGLDEAFFQTASSLEDVGNALEGRVVKAKIETRQWNGEDQNQLVIGSVQLLEVGSLDGNQAGVQLPPSPEPAAAAAPAATPAEAPAAPPAAAPAAAPPAAAAPAPVTPPAPSGDGAPLPF